MRLQGKYLNNNSFIWMPRDVVKGRYEGKEEEGGERRRGRKMGRGKGEGLTNE